MKLLLCRWKERDISLSINSHLKESSSPLSLWLFLKVVGASRLPCETPLEHN